jgi:hypothetical protein
MITGMVPTVSRRNPIHLTAWLAILVMSIVGGWMFGRGIGHSSPTAQVRQTVTETGSGGHSTAFSPQSAQGIWMTHVKAATPADFPRLLEEWKIAFPEGDNDLEGRPENALRWLFGNWLAKDSEGFLKKVTEPGFDYSHWAAEVFVKMMPEKAAKLIFGPTHSELNEYFVADGAAELAESYPGLYLKMDPDGTVVLMPGTGNYDWETAVANLAKTDVLAAANACLELDTKNGGRSLADALLSVAKVWKSGDPSMTEWMNGITDPKVRNIANQARLVAMAEKDPHAALLELYSAKLDHGNDDRIDATREILKRLAEADPVYALKLLKKVEPLFLNYKWAPGEELSAEEEARRADNPFSYLGPGRSGGDDRLEDNGVRYEILSDAGDRLPDDPGQLFAVLHGYCKEIGGEGEWQRGVEAEMIRWKSRSLTAEACLTTAGLWAGEINGRSDDKTYKKLAARAAETNPELVLASLDQLPVSARP